MAVPKQRTSKAKKRSRHAQWKKKMSQPPTGECSNCGSQKLPHRVCMNCGYYRDRQVLDVSEGSTEG